jgi:hypothetical protein
LLCADLDGVREPEQIRMRDLAEAVPIVGDVQCQHARAFG